MYSYVKCRRLIDGTGAGAIDHGVIIIEGDRIADIGYDTMPIPCGAQVIDCSTETVMPGMIDSHMHAGEDAATPEPILEQFDKPDALRALRGYVSLQKDFQAGVTTVRLLGDGTGGIDKIIRDMIHSGELSGPRVLAAVQALRPSHGTAPKVALTADGVDEVRRRTREAIFMGADVIKLFVSNISRGTTYLDYLKGDLTDVPAYTKDEIKVAVDEAHRAGLKVAVHCIGGPALRWSIEAGVDSIEHANLLEEEDIPFFLNAGTILGDPNLQLFFDKDTGFEGKENRTHRWEELPFWWHDKVRKTREQTKRVMTKALKAGVRFSLATDLNHGLLWKEAMFFVEEIGATSMQALQAVTLHSALACGVADTLGTLEKGKLADIISINGNPLEDIRHLRNVHLVMKAGVRYDHRWN